jgi:hypothetical protein
MRRLGSCLARKRAIDPPHLHVEVNTVIGAGQIPNSSLPSVVPPVVNRTEAATDRFFPRRTRVMSRAFGSPNIPWTRWSGRNPGNVYASANRRRLNDFGIRTSCQLSGPSQCASGTMKIGLAS